jgi:hypothetical protein
MRALRYLVALAALAMVAFFALRVSERGRYASPYSTLGGGPDGTLALLALTRQLGYRAEPHMHELSHLRAGGTLVAIGSCRTGLMRELSRPERDALLSWIEGGGLLIVAGLAQYLPVEVGLSTALNATCEDTTKDSFLKSLLREDEDKSSEPLDKVPFEIRARPKGPPLTHMLPFMVTRASTVAASQESEASLLIDSDAGPLAMTVPLGRGRVVFLGIPDALTNQDLALSGGALFARLLKAFAPEGPVLFDEYHLGQGERRSLFRYLRDLGYGPVLAQLGLVVMVVLLGGSARLGEPRVEPVQRPRSTRSYLAALGSLYARTRDKQGTLGVVSQRALMRIARHYRSSNVPLDELERALAERGFGAVASYVRRIREHASTPLTRGESLETRARLIDQDTTAALAVGELT